ncbi:MAG: DUF362 domain-containing protein [Desulfopila sp.]|jgi:uncharacterized protein (DUF362 family)|nr:DUF362 domain-containing protein [Desulfopila sp.]
MQRKIPVYLERCHTYDSKHLKDFFDCFAAAAGWSLRSANIFLKPNLLSAREVLACTNPQFLLALAEWFVDQGAHVSVGDSPAFGKTSGVLRALNIDKELIRQGVCVVDFSDVTHVKLACGVSTGIAAEVLQCDYFVNIPKLKAHNQMYVTMAVKNLFGIVMGVRKSMLHMRYGGADPLFPAVILDLLDRLPPHISFLDGIEVMSDRGPMHGVPLDLGCVAFSHDPVALDTALLDALRLEPGHSPLWCEAAKREYAGSVRDNLFFPLLHPEAFHLITFNAPSELSPIRFNPFRFLWNNVKRTVIRMRGS